MNKVYRQWLHPSAHSNNKSFVIAELAGSNAQYESHSLTLGDCYKHVSLEFDSGPKYKKKALAKLAKVYKALDLIQEALENE